MQPRLAHRSTALLLFALSTAAYSCGKGTAKSPFAIDAGSEAGAAGSPDADNDGGLNLGGAMADPTLGGPCTDDGQCLDELDCTTDTCDQTLKRCRHNPDAGKCADGVYCNGAEQCDPKLGCVGGPPVSCADSDPCTIDTCVEASQSCSRVPRDADGDGDAVWNCVGGGDCNDDDPTISSTAHEVCANGKDDDCDGTIDETDCVAPAHDTCRDPLLIEGSGFSTLSLAATALDYPTPCAPSDQGLRDAVLAIRVPDGPAQDIDVVAESDTPLLSLASPSACGAVPVGVCTQGTSAKSSALARLHLYGLTPGVYPFYVAANGEADVALSVQYSPASAPPSNETCGTAAPITPGVSQTAALVGTASDLSSACASQAGELVYTFTIDKPSDVRLFANPLDDYGEPQLSLRGAGCSKAEDELSCRMGSPASLFARALPAGKYYVSVGASGPSHVDVRLEVTAPTLAPADQGCVGSPPLQSGQSIDLALADHTDAVDTGCLSGAPDSTHGLSLLETSDVLLVERVSNHDTGAVSLTGVACSESARLSCGVSIDSPVRARAYGVPAGQYRAVAESAVGNPVSLTAFTRKALPSRLVALADDCSAPLEIASSGGRFQGNTANAHADFSAGCDLGNQSKNGAPDQILHFILPSKSRVILDMAGSDYATMLSVRRGPACPGSELPLACAAGYLKERSYLDLDLDAGSYYVQVDGYGGDFGAWLLDMYVTPD